MKEHIKKDYSKYFVKPNLIRARKRLQETGNLNNAFYVPLNLKKLCFNKTFYVRTYGCQANVRDSEHIMGMLQLAGLRQVDKPDLANIIILNTCAIRENAEKKVFGELGHLKKLKERDPNIIFIVCGCMVQQSGIVERIINTCEHVDLVVGTHNLHRLLPLLEQVFFTKYPMVEVWSIEGNIVENLPSSRLSQNKAFVNIMQGCDHFCTYCIVPYTRGKQRSRQKQNILQEVNELVKNGYKEVTLLGQNVNSYGLDINPDYNFANLLNDVATKTKISRIRFTTSNPWDFSDDIIDAIASNTNIMPFVHLPVQSGSDDVLRRMNRRYKIEFYKRLFDKIKTKINNVAFSTDIIVGFPQETTTDFQKTLDLYNYCQYDNAYTFIYSKREETPAAIMKDDVAFEAKKQRLYKLNELVTHYAFLNNKFYEGKDVFVLVDGVSKTNNKILSGYTSENKLVNFTGNFNDINKIVKVKINKAKSFTLDGVQI